MAKHNVKTLCDFFWYMEKKYDLLAWYSEGIPIWQYLRMPIYYKIAKEIDLFEQAHIVEVKKSLFNRLITRSIFVVRAFISFLFLRVQQADICVLEHDRSSEIEPGKFVDIYSYQIRKDFLEQGKRVVSLRIPLGIRRNKTADINPHIDLDFVLLLGAFFGKFCRTKLSNIDKQKILSIEDEIRTQFQKEVKLITYFQKYIARYQCRIKVFSWLLRKIAPKKCFVLAPYSGRGDFVGAAKQLGLECIELQHGIISRYHLGYSFPNDDVPVDNILPDQISLWGKQWNLGALFPSTALAVVNDGLYPFKLTINETVNKDKKLITIISQGVLTDEIAQNILSNISWLSKFEIKYKLHPSEFDRLNTNENLKRLRALPNIEIVTRCDLLSLMYKSQYVIGVFSTALLEAKSLGTDIVILDNLPGSEYFDGSTQHISFNDFKNFFVANTVGEYSS